MATAPRIVLASQSPRRRELLAVLGVDCRVVVTDLPEVAEPGESAEAFVVRLALQKAQAGRALSGDELPVLGADTVVVRDEVILGKPVDRDEAVAMLCSLSGREHRVLTAVAMVDAHRQQSRLSTSRVRMCAFSRAAAVAYVASGEADDKAGAYAIQGRAALLVESIEGSHSGIMGLPLYETGELLRHFQIELLPS